MIRKITLLFLSVLFITVTSCSKDDSPETTPPPFNNDGGEVFNSQLVVVDLPGINLTLQQYNGYFGPYTITLEKIDDHKLSFYIPMNVPAGNKTLTIESLNVSINYILKEVDLGGTPEVILTEFFNDLAAFENTLSDSAEDTNLKNDFESFNEYYANLSAEEKRQMATFYKANQSMFNAIFNFDMDGRNITVSDMVLITKFSAACLLAGGSAYLLWTIPEISSKIIFTIAAKVMIDKAKDLYGELSERKLNTVGLIVSAIMGENDRNPNVNFVTITGGTTATVSLNISERKVVSGDASGTQEARVSFFKSFNKYNDIVNVANNIILGLNNIPFVNLSTIPLATLPASSTPAAANATQEIFNNIAFSVNHPNLSLESYEFLSDGQMKIKVNVVGTPSSTPIETTLNYSYSDDFSSFTGTLPLKVEVDNPLIGTWTMVSFDNGVPVGNSVSTYSATCPNILAYQEFESGSFTFTETGFSYIWNNVIVMPQINYNTETCEIYGDNPDTTNNDSESGSGTYQFNGTSYILTYSGSEEQNTVQFITEDRIKIYDQEFTRN